MVRNKECSVQVKQKGGGKSYVTNLTVSHLVVFVLGDSLSREGEGHLSLFNLSRSVEQVLRVVQFRRLITVCPHVAYKDTAVGLHPTENNIRLRLFLAKGK